MSEAIPLGKRLGTLQPGDEVTLVDLSGARFKGTVVGARSGIDPEDSIGLRRSVGSVHWVPIDRIRGIE